MQKKTLYFKELSENISQCSKCSLRKSCSRVVIGSGSEKTKIVFVGEAPGKKEDELGFPFVGSSGKLLDEMLLSVGLKRNSVYITNIVKCRPPNNRDPLPKELRACTPWLVKQLETLQPKIVVTLGRHSMNFFLPQLKISSAHGRLYRIQPSFLNKPFLFFTLYHPAAALYNGKLRKTLFDDFAKIKEILKQIEKK